MCCDRWVAGLEELSREELIELARGLIAQVRELTERVARLERLVSRNSGNSSMPASMDDDLGRTAPAEEPVPGKDARGAPRRRGKREGAAGANLAWTPDPNSTLNHFPVGVCGCGSDLATAVDLGVYAAHQQTEIPLVTATVIQHDRHAVRCGCGRLHMAQRPEGVLDGPGRPGAGRLVRDHPGRTRSGAAGGRIARGVCGRAGAAGTRPRTLTG